MRPPTSQHFGSTVRNPMVERALDAVVRLDFAASGPVIGSLNAL